MIKKFDLTGLVATQYFQFLMRLMKIIDDADPTKLNIILRVNPLKIFVAKLSKVVKQDQAYEETKEIKELEDDRDDAIKGYVGYVKSMTRSKKPAVKAAAKFLLNYLNNLSKHIYAEDYSSESAILNKIYQDYLTNTEIKAAIIAIGAQDWLTQINDSNVAFEAKYQERTVEIAEDETEESFTDLRQPSKEAYYALISIINSRYDVAVYENQDTTEYLNLINNINALIIQTEQIIAATKPKKGAGKKPPTDPPVDPGV